MLRGLILYALSALIFILGSGLFCSLDPSDLLMLTLSDQERVVM